MQWLSLRLLTNLLFIRCAKANPLAHLFQIVSGSNVFPPVREDQTSVRQSKASQPRAWTVFSRMNVRASCESNCSRLFVGSVGPAIETDNKWTTTLPGKTLQIRNYCRYDVVDADTRSTTVEYAVGDLGQQCPALAYLFYLLLSILTEQHPDVGRLIHCVVNWYTLVHSH